MLYIPIRQVFVVGVWTSSLTLHRTGSRGPNIVTHQRDGLQDLASIITEHFTFLCVSQIAASLEKNLIPKLSNSPPDIEALRLYLTLPECPLFKDRNNYVTIAIPFAKSLLSLKEAPLKVLGKMNDFFMLHMIQPFIPSPHNVFALVFAPGNWWSTFEPPAFQRLVELYKEVVVYLLQMHKMGIPSVEQRIFTCFLDTSLKLLEILQTVRNDNKTPKWTCVITHLQTCFCGSRWVREQDTSFSTINSTSTSWMSWSTSGMTTSHGFRGRCTRWWVSSWCHRHTCLCLSICMNHLFLPLYSQGHDGVVTLCRYPFVFDAQAKTTLLQTDAVIQMQVIRSWITWFQTIGHMLIALLLLEPSFCFDYKLYSLNCWYICVYLYNWSQILTLNNFFVWQVISLIEHLW